MGYWFSGVRCVVIWLVLVVPAWAQLSFGDLHLQTTGDISFGYAGSNVNVGSTASGGSTANGGGSTHSTEISGNGFAKGYYYDPNFLSFTVQPYYGRSQNNSSIQSIDNANGVNMNANFFGGSHFPGSISFSRAWNTSGVYSFGGTEGLNTTENTRNFAISWSALLPNWPSLTATYARGSSSNELDGSGLPSGSNNRSFTLSSNYKLAGFTLDGSFNHTTRNNTYPLLFLGEVKNLEADNSENSYRIAARHSFPLHGTFSVDYTRRSFDGETFTENSQGSYDNADGYLHFLVWRLPVYVSVNYTGNVTDMLNQQLLASGGLPVVRSFTMGNQQLLFNVNTSYTRTLPHKITVTGYVTHYERFLGATDAQLTQFGGTVFYNFRRVLKGLYVSVGVFDIANRQGNLGASIIGNARYSHNFGRWEVGGRFGHDQSVQTQFEFGTTSTLTYGGHVSRRRLFKDINWRLQFDGAHSGLVQVAGTGSSSESYSMSMSRGRWGLIGFYSLARGTSILGLAGLVGVSDLENLIARQNLLFLNSNSYGGTFTYTPVRKLSAYLTYRKFDSDVLSAIMMSNAGSYMLNGRVTYQLRKMGLVVGFTRSSQRDLSFTNLGVAGSASTTGLPTMVTSYYFGVSRWFNLF